MCCNDGIYYSYKSLYPNTISVYHCESKYQSKISYYVKTYFFVEKKLIWLMNLYQHKLSLSYITNNVLNTIRPALFKLALHTFLKIFLEPKHQAKTLYRLLLLFVTPNLARWCAYHDKMANFISGYYIQTKNTVTDIRMRTTGIAQRFKHCFFRIRTRGIATLKTLTEAFSTVTKLLWHPY